MNDKRKRKRKIKTNSSEESDGLAVMKNDIKHIREKIDDLCTQMNTVEKNLIQVNLNKQNINSLKNNIKNIKEENIKELKDEIKNINENSIPNLEKYKIGKLDFYIVISILAILNGIAIYYKAIFG